MLQYKYILKIGKGWKAHNSYECLLNVSSRFYTQFKRPNAVVRALSIKGIKVGFL